MQPLWLSVEGRKVRTHGVLRDEEGTVYCEGDALFVKLNAKQLGVLTAKVAPLLSELKAPDA